MRKGVKDKRTLTSEIRNSPRDRICSSPERGIDKGKVLPRTGYECPERE
jgi:hypothetical protein